MGAIVNLLIGFTIAILPLFTKIADKDMSRLSKDNILVVLMGVFCFLLPNKVRQLPKIGYAALIYGLFILVFNQWNPISLMVQFHVFYIAAGMMFFACYYEKRSNDGLHYVLNGMAVGCIIQSVFTALSFLGFSAYFKMLTIFDSTITVTRIIDGVGTLGNRNLLASYISITIISLFRPRWFWFLPLALFSLYLSDSAMGFIAFIGGASYFFNSYTFKIKKLWFYLVSFFGMIAIFFIGAKDYDSSRFWAWSKIFKAVDLNHFIIGKGPGWFFDQGMIIPGSERMMQEHNEFISAFNVFGIVGILLIAPIFMKFIKKEDNNKHFSAILFAAFCNSYGHFALHQSTTAIIIIVVAAICLSEGEI